MSDVVEELVGKWIEENATAKFLAALDEAEETRLPGKRNQLKSGDGKRNE